MTTYLGKDHVTIIVDAEKEMITVSIAGVIEAIMTRGEWSDLIAHPKYKEEKALLLR